ncbi:hypothetical protein F4809DRAFT_191991 [Biscogniauxia mediterranea]|nr:hypothetical protein F4809DRAFT_191991 [Biscogniauxia mediterranea]
MASFFLSLSLTSTSLLSLWERQKERDLVYIRPSYIHTYIHTCQIPSTRSLARAELTNLRVFLFPPPFFTISSSSSTPFSPRFHFSSEQKKQKANPSIPSNLMQCRCNAISSGQKVKKMRDMFVCGIISECDAEQEKQKQKNKTRYLEQDEKKNGKKRPVIRFHRLPPHSLIFLSFLTSKCLQTRETKGFPPR